ncbi:RNA polymerase sigma factor [Oscillospiraceae bacterium LTW-04]|nr:sigma-70 family RNA polymerase sigma factor [Oscillospiraceae bacterium MB24-C1]
MNDREIIALYWERSEAAVEETEKKYGKLCRHIAMNILQNSQDVEECINDTFLGTWNSIPPQKPAVLSAYICRIARNCALKKYHYNNSKKRNKQIEISFTELEDCISQNASEENSCETELLAKAISTFLRTLSYENRTIFMRKYWFFDSISDIANRFSMSESKVKSILFRTRGKLKEFLMKEGINI